MSNRAAVLQLVQLSSRLDPWAVRAAATLRLPDLVADGADTTSELAARSGTDPDALGRLMRHLRILGLFRTTAAGRWELAELGELLRDDHPMRIRRTLDQADHYVQKVDRSAHGLLEAVRTGGAVWERLHGLSFWDDMSADPRFGRGFDAQMARHSALYSPAITRGYDWSTVEHVVDVGGGTGRTLVTILGTHPHLRATLVDLPGPVAGAATVLEEADVAGRCVVVAQSFFDPLPPGGDVYLLANTVHDWSDEDSARILRRCAQAAGPGGRVLLADRVVTDEADEAAQAFVSGVDLLMLMLNSGRERSEEEFRELGATAGLRHTATHALADYPLMSLVEYVVEG
ncbi:MAG: methyltransferase [Pseudonocardiales bacterium]|nr:methyltransferase [Pseudonocardiales bacterium]